MKVYNTLTRSLEEVKPLEDNKIKVYTCGLTVYSQPHLGNWVAYIYWDILVRTLKEAGFDVTRVQNITDVGHLTSDEDAGEDKMEKGARREGLTAWDVAEKYIKIADHEAYTLLGLLKPVFMPRATEYIQQQIDFVKELEKKGYTYPIDDGIYFDTSKLKDYGKLARLDIEGLKVGARVDSTGKKNSTDFALWKLSPSDVKRDMEWDSPWGKGFPGWHLECSVMAREILGDQIDIHTGGIDHIPVHHTNEIAQTEALTGKPFASLWIHANHIKVNGTKMSKSLGNVYTLQDIVDQGYSIDAFKLMILSKHYRTEGNFTWEILESFENRIRRWKNIAEIRWQITNPNQPPESIGKTSKGTKDTLFAIKNVLQMDLKTPAAIEYIESYLNNIEQHILQGMLDHPELLDLTIFFKQLDSLFGFHIINQTQNIEGIEAHLNKRDDARKNKDWITSDKIRDELKAQGIGINDSASGQIWYRL
ncbi:MAG TPA: cysteine--tRNA ligase [Candidatus Saccharibacteria bacterium]|jgi:cysteinyl-tRNA synthetase|nr:cysteine--tRNA ligase [Candidatus Saccharibacteria bacterium]HMT55360.1 cysteine--tRNA ligase [Candidatus Saccharibacteria bacterium]